MNQRLFRVLIVCVSAFLLISCLSVVWANPAHQTVPLTTAQPIRAFLARTHSVGLVVGVWDHGQTEVAGYGKLAKDRDGTPDGNTLFEIGSMTKIFTATILADMVTRGEVALDDPAQRYLPPEVTMPAYPGDPAEITLRHLATHTSGLPRLPDNLFANILATLFPADPYAAYSEAKLYQFLSGYTLPRRVGSEAEYSNLGVGLLGLILARQAHTDFETLVRTRICEPLNLPDTWITLSAEQQQRLAQGHSKWGRPVSYWHFQDATAGAGALHSTVNDLLIFIAANLGAHPSALDAALALTHQVHAPFQDQLSIALGWIVLTTEDGDTVIWHNGGTGGFASFMAFNKTRQLGIVVLSNSEQSVDALALELLLQQPPSQ